MAFFCKCFSLFVVFENLNKSYENMNIIYDYWHLIDILCEQKQCQKKRKSAMGALVSINLMKLNKNTLNSGEGVTSNVWSEHYYMDILNAKYRF